MNCKQGDLAIIVSSKWGNEGAIVHCVALFPNHLGREDIAPYPAWGVNCARSLNRPSWAPSDYAWCRSRGFDELVADAYLRPIRDQPGADETLAWLPIPQPVETT